MLQLTYEIRTDRQLGHMVVATLPEHEGYSIFVYGTQEHCEEYLDNLTPEFEAAEIEEIRAINKAG